MIVKPRLLDLFCGAGGAAMGYHRAGFRVTGVDNRPQPHYPFRFVQMDAFRYLERYGRYYDVVHASPPCQAHTALRTAWNAKPHVSLIEPTRERLQGHVYVIENVPGAPLLRPIRLCGTAFGLGVSDAELRRHRLFESSIQLKSPPACVHYRSPRVIGVYGGHGRRRTIGVYGGGHGESLHRHERGQRNYTVMEQREAMGIGWMTVGELSQAIPPAYTEYIGRQLMKAIR